MWKDTKVPAFISNHSLMTISKKKKSASCRSNIATFFWQANILSKLTREIKKISHWLNQKVLLWKQVQNDPSCLHLSSPLKTQFSPKKWAKAVWLMWPWSWFESDQEFLLFVSPHADVTNACYLVCILWSINDSSFGNMFIFIKP